MSQTHLASGGPMTAPRPDDDAQDGSARSAREDRLISALSELTAQLGEAVQTLRAPAGGERSAEEDGRLAEWRRRAETLTDDLREVERECAELREQNDRLITEQARLMTLTDEAQTLVAAMEATRGWKMLLWLRRWRNRLRGRS